MQVTGDVIKLELNLFLFLTVRRLRVRVLLSNNVNREIKGSMEPHLDNDNILQQKTYQLQERMKELNCLYGISKFIENSNGSLDYIIQKTVDLIPISWQYPEITSARIVLDDKVFETDDFQESAWKQATCINVYDKEIGIVEVYYSAEMPEFTEGPFLKEERNLINAIAERMGHIYERIDTEIELKKYREKMFQAERLASLGIIGSAVAHQLNQPLSIICMSLQKALRDLQKPGSVNVVKEMLGDSLNQVAHASSIVKGFLALGHASPQKKIGTIDFHAIAVKTITFFTKIAKNVKVQLIIEDSLRDMPAITCVASEVEQIFFILTQNAIQAADANKKQWFKVSGSVKEEQIELAFSDNCGGIESDNLDKIFDPFFTTKPVEQGTGLGLPILRQIVTNNDGTVRVDSEFGKGTTFYVTLPIKL